MAGRYSRFSKARTLLSNLFAACSVYSWSVISPICKNYHKGRQPPTRHHSIFYTDTVSLYQLENQKQNVIRYIINKQTQFKSNIHRSRSVGYYRRWYQIESMFPALVIIKVRKCADKTENQKKFNPANWFKPMFSAQFIIIVSLWLTLLVLVSALLQQCRELRSVLQDRVVFTENAQSQIDCCDCGPDVTRPH